VKSFDSRTGDIEIEEKYVEFEGKPFSILLNPQEFYWWDMYVRDVQDQQRVAWVQHYSKMDVEREFSKFPNYKFIKDKTEAKRLQLEETLYFKEWQNRVQDSDDYEVLRMYSKVDDNNKKGVRGYEVWINGVPMIRTPLLWGENEKIYPFAKQISQPFANSNFFVGMSWPAILESYQDHKNTHINTLIDKTYRSMEAPMLVGLQNKDLFDMQSQLVNQDNRYYVPDVNQVKPYPVDAVNRGELELLSVLNQGIELMSVDRSQQGIASDTQKTARQAVIDDARAQELKGSLYLSLEDHWYQKTKLRTGIIISHFIKDKAAQSDKKGQIISIKDYTFGDGERGILDIHIAKSKGQLLTKQEIETREAAMEKQGQPYKLISIPKSWLNEYTYDFVIVSQSFHNQQKLAKSDELLGEVQEIGTIAPEFLQANKEEYIKRIIELHGRHIDQYKPVPPPAPAPATPEGSLLGLEQPPMPQNAR
jgi:hypothetical protein